MLPLPSLRTEELARLLAGREGQTDPVSERLRWFLHFAQSQSVSATCRQFRIPRTTFYRWARRFDPQDLTTLENRPTVASSAAPPSGQETTEACEQPGRPLVLDESDLSSRPVEGKSSDITDPSTSVQQNQAVHPYHMSVSSWDPPLPHRLQSGNWSAYKRALVVASVLTNLALAGLLLLTVFLEGRPQTMPAERLQTSASLLQP